MLSPTVGVRCEHILLREVIMSEKEYAKEILDIVPEEKMCDVIEYLMSLSDETYDRKKFDLVSRHLLQQYRKAFEELAK